MIWSSTACDDASRWVRLSFAAGLVSLMAGCVAATQVIPERPAPRASTPGGAGAIRAALDETGDALASVEHAAGAAEPETKTTGAGTAPALLQVSGDAPVDSAPIRAP